MNGYANDTDSKRRRSAGWWTEPRYWVVAACFLAAFSAYVERVGFSIAYTAMARGAGVDEAVKGTVMSAFYWGYGVSQVPGGFAAQRWGGRVMLSLCFMMWSTASLLTPATAASTAAIIAARVCVGIAQGFLIPAVHTVLSQCIPPNERARAVSLTTSGMYLGSAGAMAALPSLAARMGPGYLLKANGALGLTWLLLWQWVGGKLVARQTAIPVTSLDQQGRSRGKAKPATPWVKMLAHPAVWAIVVNNFTFHYAFYVVMNWLPTYFDAVLHKSLSDLGLVKTLPYLIMFVASNAGGWAGDWLISRRLHAVAGARKTVNSAGFWGAAAALMVMPMARGVGSGILATSLVLGTLGCARGGFSVNHMDIAPKYAGVVMGISNTAGTVSGMIGVAFTGWLLDQGGGSQSLVGWHRAFAVAALQCLGGSIIFILFGRGERIFGETDQYDGHSR